MLKDMGEGVGEQRRGETREWVLMEALGGPPLGRSSQMGTGNKRLPGDHGHLVPMALRV